MTGLKEIYQQGWAVLTDTALAAERRIATAHEPDTADLTTRKAEVTARNKSQLR